MQQSLDLSIILPLYNEALRLAGCMQRLSLLLAVVQDEITCEVLLVDNGSTDDTYRLASMYQSDDVHVYHLPDRGKGAAVKHGMLAAGGRWRMMADCDWSMPPDQIYSKFWEQRRHAPIIIGSRNVPGAIRSNEPWQRRLSGRVYRALTSRLLPGISDTQCGYKLFYGPAAVQIFSRQTITGLSFDLEILHIARILGYKIRELPIYWVYDGNSRVRLVRDAARMLWDIRAISTNTATGAYDRAPRQI